MYSKQVLPEIVKLIAEDNSIETEADKQKKCGCQVLQLVKNINAKVIDIANEYDSYKEGMFLNMNRPEDFEIVNEKLMKKMISSIM